MELGGESGSGSKNLKKPNLQGGRKSSWRSSCISLVPLELLMSYVRNPSANSFMRFLPTVVPMGGEPWEMLFLGNR